MSVYYKFSTRKSRERKPHKKSPEKWWNKTKQMLIAYRATCGNRKRNAAVAKIGPACGPSRWKIDFKTRKMWSCIEWFVTGKNDTLVEQQSSFGIGSHVSKKFSIYILGLYFSKVIYIDTMHLIGWSPWSGTVCYTVKSTTWTLTDL